MWERKYHSDGFSVQAAIAKGRELPEWYYNEPDIDIAEEYLLKIFCDLDTCRRFSPGPIPWTDIVHYIDRLDYGNELSGTIEKIIRLVDTEFLSILDKEKPKKVK